MRKGQRIEPSVARNRAPILKVIGDFMPESGAVLELASGSGEHALAFARAFPHLTFQPTDRDEAALASIRAWCAEGQVEDGISNLREPVQLDVTHETWPVPSGWDMMIAINMIHIAPLSALEGLMRGAGRMLKPGGCLFLYGPYKIEGRHTAPSNAAFDDSLKARNARWGLRDVADVTLRAEAHGLIHEAMIDMPSNNHALVYRKAPA